MRWGGVSAIVNVSFHEPRTIIGVVSDASHSSLREPRRPALYDPLAQNAWPRPFPDISLSVRSAEQARRCYFGGAAKKQL